MKPWLQGLLELPAKTSFPVLSFHLMLTYVKILQEPGFKRFKIIWRNHNLAANLFKKCWPSSSTCILCQSEFSLMRFLLASCSIFYDMGHTLPGDFFFYQISYHAHRLLTLGGFMVFPQIISDIVPNPADI